MKSFDIAQERYDNLDEDDVYGNDEDNEFEDITDPDYEDLLEDF